MAPLGLCLGSELSRSAFPISFSYGLFILETTFQGPLGPIWPTDTFLRSFYTVSRKWEISSSYLDCGLALRNRRSESRACVPGQQPQDGAEQGTAVLNRQTHFPLLCHGPISPPGFTPTIQSVSPAGFPFLGW